MSKKRQMAHVTTLAYDYPAGHFIEPHTHVEHQLIYASSGVMTVHTPRGSWVVPVHRAVWVPGKTEHSIQISGMVAMRTLYLAPRLSRSLPVGCQVLSVSPLLRELVLHMVELGRLDRREPAHARLIGVLVDQLRVLVLPALRLPQPRDPRALRVAGEILARPGDARALPLLCRGSGASLRTIERLFQVETGMSFGRWRQQARMVEALRRLAGGEPVTRVALDVGYDSPSAFISTFRRTFGTTPGRYFRAASLGDVSGS
jgi:AraC-like DNA-binding protein